MRPTLVFVRHTEIGDRQFHHGDELPPGLLPREVVDQWLDHGRLQEYRDRRSLYRLLPAFSGCNEAEPLTPEEINAYALPP